MADEIRIAQLIVNRLRGTLSESEKEELDTWIAASPDHRLFLETRVTPQAVAENLKNMAELDHGSLDRKIWDRIRTAPPKDTRNTKKIIQKILIAAAAVLFAVYLKSIFKPDRLDFTPYHSPIWDSQSPAMSQKVQRATLTMAGTLLDLDTLPVGRRIWLGNWLILKREPHQLAYLHRAHGQPSLSDSDYNRISIPSGDRTWLVVLPDGSKIGLSPGSSLSFVVYPTEVLPHSRRALLDGEAIVQVAHNDRIPFILESEKNKIKVQGTVFSIRDFSNENTSTILQYSDSLEITNGWSHVTLHTDEQATITRKDPAIHIARGITPHPPDILKPESFDFSHCTLDSAFRQLADWYGIARVSIDHDLHADTLKKLGLGHISKDLSLSQLLEQLQKTTNTMHFTANEDMLSVSKQTSSGPDQTR
jgi:transmembrane sensor